MAGRGGIVVVGGGLASARAIKAYREAGGEERLMLISADESLPYHRPPLSKRFLRGEAEARDALVESEDFYRGHDVDVRLETRATALSAAERRIELEGGSAVPFERLLIATGASPRHLDVPGAELDGVHTLRTLRDATKIRDEAGAAQRAVVVGAGFIGMEIAASLTHLGVAVTLVHRGTELFEVLRAPELARFLAELYAERGVELVLGDEVASFEGAGARIARVTTKAGRSFDADIAVVGIGVTPNTGWLEGSGLELDDGVVVDDRYRTESDGIYAAGDVARFYDPLFEKHRRIEHWSNANHQGAQVGRILAGADERYEIVSTFFSEVFGLSVKVFGDVDDFDELVFRGAPESGDAIGFYTRGGRLVACLVIGQDDDTEAKLKELLAACARVDDPRALADDGTSLDEAFAVSPERGAAA